MQEKERELSRASPEMIEASLLLLVRNGAQARYIGRDAPDLGRLITHDLADEDASTPRERWIYAERALRRLIAEHASPFYRDRLMIMFALSPGMEGTSIEVRASAAAATVDLSKWEGITWRQYRYNRSPDEVRALADRIYEYEFMPGAA